MVGITMEQARELMRLTKELWVLLSQEDYQKIMEIYRNSVDEEIEFQEKGGINEK